MKVIEVYTYDKAELEKSKYTTVNPKDDIKYITENTFGNLFLANTNDKVGFISYINNIVVTPDITFNTSIGTVITPIGKIVFSLNYIVKIEPNLIIPPINPSIIIPPIDPSLVISAPKDGELLIAEPIFKDGVYLGFNNLRISIQVIDSIGKRILVIEYDNLL